MFIFCVYLWPVGGWGLGLVVYMYEAVPHPRSWLFQINKMVSDNYYVVSNCMFWFIDIKVTPMRTRLVILVGMNDRDALL